MRKNMSMSTEDKIRHYQRSIDRSVLDKPRLLHCIEILSKLPVTVQHLQLTGIGRTVNALRKIEDGVGDAAKSLVAKWKYMVANTDTSEEEDEACVPDVPESYESPECDSEPETAATNNRSSDDNQPEALRRLELSPPMVLDMGSPLDSPARSLSNERGTTSNDEEKSTSHKSEESRDKHRKKSSGHSSKQSSSKDKTSRKDIKSKSSSKDRYSSSTKDIPESSKVSKGSKSSNISEHRNKDKSKSKSESSNSSSSSKDKKYSEKRKRKLSSSSDRESDRKRRKESESEEGEEDIEEDEDNKFVINNDSSSSEQDEEENEEEDDNEEEEDYKERKMQLKNKESSLKGASHSDKAKSKEKHHSSPSHSKTKTHESSDKSKRDDKHSSSKSDKYGKEEKPKGSENRSKESSKSKTSHSSSSSKDHSKDKDRHSKDKAKETSSKSRKQDKEKGNKEVKDDKGKCKEKSSKEYKENKGNKEHKEHKEHRDCKEQKERKESKDHKENKEHKEKKQVKKSSSGDGGIDCNSGTSFADALGMCTMLPPSKKKKEITSPVLPKSNKPELSSVSSSSNSSSSTPSSSKSSVAKTRNEIPDSSESLPLLSPNVKLEPLSRLDEEVDLASTLPEPSLHYKPLPHVSVNPAQRRQDEENMLSLVIHAKNQRTKVYSGNKTGYTVVPTLYEMCIRVLIENIDALEFTGGVPYYIIKPVLERATPDQLFMLEHYNPYLIEESDPLWQFHCNKDFRTKKREEMESWREMYMRCLDEREAKLKALTANIKQSIDKSTPVRSTKLAYVDNIVKPPRNVLRKQAKYGTAKTVTNASDLKKKLITSGVGGSTASSSCSIATSSAERISVPPPPPSRMRQSSSHAVKKAKAPLMAKALQAIKGRYKR